MELEEGEGWCFMPPRNARNPPYLLLPRGIEFIAGKNNPTDLPERQCGLYLFTAIPRFWYQLALWVFRDVDSVCLTASRLDVLVRLGGGKTQATVRGGSKSHP